MIKRILVALDVDTDTPIAVNHAIKLAKTFDASITGLAIVDSSNIAANVGGDAIGATYYPDYYLEDLGKHMAEEAREEAGKLLENFEEMTKKAGVKNVQILEEGVPYQRIIEDLKYHDLLVIGRESHFFYNQPETETNTLEDVVKKAIAPTFVATKTYREVERVAIAHDGSSASARALQWFIQLEPYGKDIEIDIIHVCDLNHQMTVDNSKLLLHLVRDYLKAHEYRKINEQLLDKGDTDLRIINYVKENAVDLVIMGAHSVSALRRLTFGSTTHELVKNSPVPLFLSR